jgi:hypothetical protein
MTPKMNVEQAVTQFHWCCRAIIQNKNVKALNWCVDYAYTGEMMNDPLEVKVQILYILNNMQYWRGELATKVRKSLKEIQAALKNY